MFYMSGKKKVKKVLFLYKSERLRKYKLSKTDENLTNIFERKK